jgi:hypothetical protein
MSSIYIAIRSTGQEYECNYDYPIAASFSSETIINFIAEAGLKENNSRLLASELKEFWEIWNEANPGPILSYDTEHADESYRIQDAWDIEFKEPAKIAFLITKGFSLEQATAHPGEIDDSYFTTFEMVEVPIIDSVATVK